MDSGRVIAALSDGSFLVAGVFQGTATFGPGESNETAFASASSDYPDIFVAKHNADGTLDWVRSAGGSDEDYVNGISMLSDGSALVTGYFYGTATFGQDESNETALTSAGENDLFIAKLCP